MNELKRNCNKCELSAFCSMKTEKKDLCRILGGIATKEMDRDALGAESLEKFDRGLRFLSVVMFPMTEDEVKTEKVNLVMHSSITNTRKTESSPDAVFPKSF